MGGSIISGVLSTASSSLSNTPANAKNTPQKIQQAATEFESLMIGQIMKSMHEEQGEGWLGTGEDQTASSAMGMADEYFGRAMASKGGFGLARMISTSMEKRETAVNERE